MSNIRLVKDYKLNVGVNNHIAVISHLRSVLNMFANKPEYSKFYIGITLEERRAEHQRKKPEYKLMCDIYEEQVFVVENSFHNLERDVIKKFSSGIKHPDTGKVLLKCENEQGGSSAKRWLYVLIG